MCGICGVYGSEDAPALVLQGMRCQQKRGQNGAGMAVPIGNGFDLRKGAGMIRDIEEKLDFASMRGCSAIGHTRYPTVADGERVNAQPESLGIIAAVHNGNIINGGELTPEFERREVRFERHEVDDGKGGKTSVETKCDVKYILGGLLLGLEGNKEPGNDDLFRAARRVMENVKGAYSVAALIKGGGEEKMLVFTDPLRIRPCVVGRRGDAHMVASETTSLKFTGFYDDVFDLGPGEAVIFSRQGVERRSLLPMGFMPCMFEWVYFARPDSIIDGVPVVRVRKELGRKLAENEPYKFDVIVPVPDSGRTHAEGFARALYELHGRYVPIESGYTRRRDERIFISPDKENRAMMVWEKFAPIEHIMRDMDVLLGEDSFVRGDTSKELVAMARKAGARKVHVRASAVPRYPCFDGIDFPSLLELGATKVDPQGLLSHEELERAIAGYIGADSFRFNPPEVVGNVIRNLALESGNPQSYNPCTACLDGNYPTQDRQELLQIVRTLHPDKRVYEMF